MLLSDFDKFLKQVINETTPKKKKKKDLWFQVTNVNCVIIKVNSFNNNNQIQNMVYQP
jgi:hypothetical protein